MHADLLMNTRKRAVLFVLLSSLVFASDKKAATFPNTAELIGMAGRFAPTDLTVDVSRLARGDRAALAKLIEAARIMDTLQLEQRWSGSPALYAKLKQDATPLGRARLHYFWINKGPWSALDDNAAFLPGVPPKKPLGANFYPANATRAELEKWMGRLPDKEREQAQWFFTLIRRGPDGRLRVVPYSQAYQTHLVKAAKLLREAAALTTSSSLKKFLNLRASAFLSNDYFESDAAWMDLDSPVDVTIGPYETYNDELFGYKAAFEAYVAIRDEKETEKVKFFANHMQELENNLPIPAEHRNPKVGALAPMVVVNEVFGAGDGNMGVQTAAYNLPNDERVVQQKGAKRIMLKNVQEAKFRKTLVAISRVVLPPAAQPDLDFDSFFTHIVAHEITHGLGPQQIKVAGRDTTVRQELKEVYGTIEEAKADVTGLQALQYLMDRGLLKDTLGQGEGAERRLYHTYLASAFRTLRFGVTDSHARGMAIQFNYLSDKGAFLLNMDGTFSVDFARIKSAVRDLDRDLLMLEATGDYAGAKKMIESLSVIRPEMRAAMNKLKATPTDIEPVFVTANQIAPRAR